MFIKTRRTERAGLPSVVSGNGAASVPAQANAGKKITAKKITGRRWVSGMVAGQVVFFAAALHVLPLFVLPPAAVLPALFAATLTGGLLGGFVQSCLTGKAQASPPAQMRAYIFQALTETNRKLAEMFVDEDFNAAANNNSDSRRMKARPELKISAPQPPRMGGM
ncbi:MAG: hypothetical protein KGL10_04615 [Alphaproteobacteria bacterium]|nr:hypothetical protein [Alphaproteobacteria bacterium]